VFKSFFQKNIHFIEVIDEMEKNYSNAFHVLFDSGGQKLTFKYVINQYWEDEGDPRSKNFPLFGDGPAKMLAVMAFYLLFVLMIGMKLCSIFIFRLKFIFHHKDNR